MAKKILNISIRAVAIILIIICLLLLLARLIFKLPVSSYYFASEKSFFIPSTHDGYVAQGLTYDERTESFFLTGYMTDKSPSPLYIVDKNNGTLTKTLTMLTEKDEAYTGHSGGIAVSGDYIYIAGGGSKCVYVYSYNDALNAENGTPLACLGKFSTKISGDNYIRVSFVEAIDGKLYVGEYYNTDYTTPDSHKMHTPDGAYQQAVIVEYNLDNSEFGINPTPVNVYSIRDKVQGMTVSDGKIYLASSAGAEFSKITAYDISKVPTGGSINTILETEMQLCYLDSTSLVEEYTLPPMAEEIAIVDGKLYTMCESASNKYIFGKLTSSEWCYATDLSAFGKSN